MRYHWGVLLGLVVSVAACGGTSDEATIGYIEQSAICGANDLQNVETWIETDGVTEDFIGHHKNPVGRTSSGCSGTLIGDGLFLTVAHCIPPGGVDSVTMNYNMGADGVALPTEVYRVAFVVEDDGVSQHGLLQLIGNPENRWGLARLEGRSVQKDMQLAYIGHPYQLNHPTLLNSSTYKVAEVGQVHSNDDNTIYFKRMDVRGGASGSGVLATDTGGLIGIIRGGQNDGYNCGSYEVANWANTILRVFSVSSVVTGDVGSLWGYTTENRAITHVSVDHAVPSTWLNIVSGRFTNTAFDSLFTYDALAGVGQFYTVNSHTKTQPLGGAHNVLRRWSSIAAVQFDGTGPQELFFYDMRTGYSEVYNTNGSGNLTRLRYGTINSAWTAIVSGDFTTRTGPEMLFYNAQNGSARLYGTNTNGTLTLLSITTLRTGLTSLVSGNFDDSGLDTVLGYSGTVNASTFVTFNGNIMITNPWLTMPSEYFSQVVAGRYSFSSTTNLLFYAPQSGNVYLYETLAGQLSLIRSEQELANMGKLVTGQYNNNTGSELIFYNRFRDW